MDKSALEFGESLRDELAEEFEVDTEGWAFELVGRVAKRLQAFDPEDERLIPVVTWAPAATAFTAPGRYIFFSRMFLEMSLPEEAVAFVFAHELGHHRLDHLDRFGLVKSLRSLPGVSSIVSVLAQGDRFLSQPKRELDADRWALRRCLEAGYDGRRCLLAFTAMERYMLDRGDIAGVFGPEDPEIMLEAMLDRLEEPEDTSVSGTITRAIDRARRWRWEHMRGYVSVRERRHEVMQELRARTAPLRVGA